jgi:hypothetical protein
MDITGAQSQRLIGPSGIGSAPVVEGNLEREWFLWRLGSSLMAHVVKQAVTRDYEIQTASS